MKIQDMNVKLDKSCEIMNCTLKYMVSSRNFITRLVMKNSFTNLLFYLEHGILEAILWSLEIFYFNPQKL